MDAADERVWAVTVNPHSMVASEFRRSRLPSAKFSNRDCDVQDRCRRLQRGDWQKKRKTGSVYIGAVKG